MARSAAPPPVAAAPDLDPADPQYAVVWVDWLLRCCQESGASDLHLLPQADGLDCRYRLDGVLQPLAALPSSVAANLVARLKVLSGLLTYRTEVPQEGRIQAAGLQMRISTCPTLAGEKAVVRFFAPARQLELLPDLGLTAELLEQLTLLVRETSGAILVTGPAGSGKTTTLYACLREAVQQSQRGRSLVSLEDPIEVAVPGVAQTQVNAAAGLDLAQGLKFLLRQDPQVILLGEIRDRPTAEVALEAALTGHLVLSSLHAGTACAAINRLATMGLEPYVLRSGILAIVSQRLVRRLCDCAGWSDAAADRLGLPVERVRLPGHCDQCRGTGYQGRLLLAELLLPECGQLGPAIAARAETAVLQQLATQAGQIGLWTRACQAVAAGQTSPAEVRRVLGAGG